MKVNFKRFFRGMIAMLSIFTVMIASIPVYANEETLNVDFCNRYVTVNDQKMHVVLYGELDQNGVGKLVEMAVLKGKSTRPDIHLGICGEHGGEPSSVEFCHRVGLNYVSCSPFRVPIARLAAAQAAIKNGGQL